MGLEAAPDVRFDFTGSLALARQLWQFAEELEELATCRNDAAAEALTTWQGTYGEEFVERITTEVVDLGTAAAHLQAGAQGWAHCWASAMNQQNRILHAREVLRVQNDRSGWDSFWGGIVGHGDLPPEPSELSVPQPPYFVATGRLVTY